MLITNQCRAVSKPAITESVNIAAQIASKDLIVVLFTYTDMKSLKAIKISGE